MSRAFLSRLFSFSALGFAAPVTERTRKDKILIKNAWGSASGRSRKLLGHSDVATTMIVLNRGGRGVKSPLDTIE